MFAFIARRQYLQGLAHLERGAFDELLGQFGPSGEFTFVGRSPLGERLRSREALRRWFARLHTLLLRPRCEVRELLITGWPWAPAPGRSSGDSQHRSRRALREPVRPVPAHPLGTGGLDCVIEDTQRFEGAVARRAAAGVAEVRAAPIRDSPRLEDTDKHVA